MSTTVSSIYCDGRYWYRAKFGATPFTDWIPAGLQGARDLTITKEGSLPGWRRLIASGLNATTDLNADGYSYQAEPASYRHYVQDILTNSPNDRIEYEFKGFLPSDPMPTLSGAPSVSSSAVNLALSKLYQHLASVETSFKGMVFAGELRESLEMIRHPARALRKGLGSYLDQIKRFGPRVPRKRRVKFVRDTWLEYSFGWRPLISDLDSAIKAFYNSRLTAPIFEMVRGKADFDTPSSVSSPSMIDLQAGAVLWYQTQLGTIEQVKYYGIYQSHGNGTSDSHIYGWRPVEFLPTLWELIPYSFLVDYFTNIGDIISSWSYRFIGLNWCARTVYVASYKRYINMRYEGNSIDYNQPTRYFRSRQGGPGSSESRRFSLLRSKSVPLDIPSLELQVPGMSSLKWINMAALTKQLDSTRRAIR